LRAYRDRVTVQLLETFAIEVQRPHLSFCAPASHRTGHNAFMAVVYLSVRLSVPCLILSRERTGIGNWNLTRRKPVTRVTSDPT